MKSSTNKIKKYAGKAIKNVPKKKIINQAAIYGVKKIIGGPFLDIAALVFNKTKKKALSYAGSYAYESFFRSKFAREKINTIPMTIMTLIIRSIFSFLILNRVKTGVYWFDFIVSIIITIIITVLSPIFYTSVKAHEDAFMKWTNIFIDNFLGENGWEYLDNFKNAVVLTIGIIIIIILQIVEVNSRYIQEMIIHAMITGYLSDQLAQMTLDLSQKRIFYIGLSYIDDEPKYIIPAILPCRTIKRCHTKNIVFKRLNPIKAKIVKINDIK